MRALVSSAAAAAPSAALLALLSWLLLLLTTAPAGAIQFTPGANDRLNTFASGAPGSPFNTAPGGVDFDAVGSAGAHPGEVVVNGEIPSLFINGSTQVSFGTDIQFRLEAAIANLQLDTSDPSNAQLIVEFSGTNDGLPDLVLTDPSDSTILLESNLVSGALDPDGAGLAPSQAVAPLIAVVPFDLANIPAQPNGQAFAFFQNEVNGNPWEVLFSDGIGTLNDQGLAQTLISNFMPDFQQLVSQVLAANPPLDAADLPSLEAEANGFLFRLAGSQFQVPEPAAAWLLAAGALGAGVLGRRRRG